MTFNIEKKLNDQDFGFENIKRSLEPCVIHATWFDDREMAPPDPLSNLFGTKQMIRNENKF